MGDDLKNDDNISLNDLRNYSWEYFKLHAEQRMKLFNFFLVFASIITTGLASTFQPAIKTHYIGVALSILLIVVSFIFWKLDERNKYLTKHGENTLKFLENNFRTTSITADDHAVVRLFNYEEFCTADLKRNQSSCALWKRQLSHSKSLNCLFLIFVVIGIAGTITSVIMLRQQQTQKLTALATARTAVRNLTSSEFDEFKGWLTIDDICQKHDDIKGNK